MALSKSKDGAGRVNAENIGGAKVPKRGGVSDQRKSSPNRSMNAPQLFTKANFGSTVGLKDPQGNKETSLSAGAKPSKSGKGGTGPTLPPVG